MSLDLNLVVLRGRLAAPPEDVPGGGTRLLVAVGTDEPKRVDVLPVLVAEADNTIAEAEQGDQVWVVGSVRRRFVEGSWGPRSLVEVAAEEVRIGGES